MTHAKILYLSLSELCKVTSIPTETIFELVNEGIVDPIGDTHETWQFDLHMLTRIRKAVRLHSDLAINWPGIAFALSLIDEMEILRSKNERLQLRLKEYYPNQSV